MTIYNGEAFLQYEPLTTRLKGLVHDYPEGIGIFKELIQNADDAGAKRIEFILDWRHHKFTSLDYPSFAKLFGPAMLVFNDAVFNDEDFDGLKRLGEGAKKDNLRKTGRFGRGFNSIYNLTDYPSFISREWICFFDPHGTAIPNDSRGERWVLKEVSENQLIELYKVGGFDPDLLFFQGTLFRFPFRTIDHASRSEICKTPFTREQNAEPLLKELLELGEDLLIFLKSIEEIKVREIEEDGSEEIRIHIKTINSDEVSEARQKFLPILDHEPIKFISICKDKPDILPCISYIHKICSITPTEIFESTWRVVHLMKVDEDGELVKTIQKLHQQREKAVPWGGAAARITSDRPGDVKGKQYCFLPLPQTYELGLSIHIHGYFDLDSSRQSSTGGENTGNAAARSEWNKLLIEYVIASACVQLIVDLVADIGDIDPYKFYQLWPINSTNSELLKSLKNSFIKNVKLYKVFRSNLSDKWVIPDRVYILEEEAAKNLFDPLTADSICVPDPELPSEIILAFQEGDIKIKKLTPKWLKDYLRKVTEDLGVELSEAPLASLRNKKWLLEILKYCLTDYLFDLQGLPLALLENGTLQRFGFNPCGWIYAANELEREIFANHLDWFLDSDLQAEIESVLSSEIKGITILNPQLVACRLKDLDCWAENDPQIWEPHGNKLPNADFLIKIYNYFASAKKLPSDELNQLPIVPGDDGFLHRGGNVQTPLRVKGKPSPAFQEALEYFGVLLISSEDIWQSVFSRFFRKHPSDNGMIWELTGSDLIDTIFPNRKSLPIYNKEHYAELLNYFTEQISNLNDDAKSKLKKIPIFSTIHQKVISLDESRVYQLSADIPDLPIKFNLLENNVSNVSLQQIFKILNVQKLTLSRLIEDCILPEYGSWEPVHQLKALNWIRINLSSAIEEIRKDGGNHKNLKQKISNSSLIRCEDNILRSVKSVYRPKEKIIREVLGADAPVPDMSNTYKDEPDLWLEFFDTLGIQHTPSPQDIINYTDKLSIKCQQTSVSAVKDACSRLFKYICEHWDDLSSSSVFVNTKESTFASALRNKVWLPVENDPSELAKYPGAMPPSRKGLYRSDEVLFIQDANLAASQRPLFRIAQQPSPQVRQALGFKDVTAQEIQAHFDCLLEIWQTKRNSVNIDNFKKAINRIYFRFQELFITGNIDRNARSNFKNHYVDKKCLWDTKGNFWKPNQVFEKPVSYFGNRRISLGGEHKYIGLYRLLGQRISPNFQDYLDFIGEFEQEYRNSPITDEQEIKNIVDVLKRMVKEIKNHPDKNYKPNFLLTEDGFLLLPKQVMIPDADWLIEAVKEYNQVKLLHPEVDHYLGEVAKSPSLLQNVEEVLNGELPQSHKVPEVLDKAEKWQNNLRSDEFYQGLKRIIYHEHKKEINSEFSWLKDVELTFTKEVFKDLFFNKNKIANRILATSHFDTQTQKFYITHNKNTSGNYLGNCLNEQLSRQNCGLSNPSNLIAIIDLLPNEIHVELDALKVKSLPKELNNADDSEEESPIITFGSNDSEQGNHSINNSDLIPDQKNPSEDNSDLIPDQNKPQERSVKVNLSPPSISHDKNEDRDEDIERSKSFPPTAVNVSGKRDRIKNPNGRSLKSPQAGGKSKITSSGQEIISVKKDRSPSTTRGDRWKTCVYVQPENDPSNDSEKLIQADRSNVDRAGIQRVLEYEKNNGRTPTEMASKNPGYDIESLDHKSTRYIEVKSFRGYWPKSGAKMTIRQFKEAQHKGSDFWLYIVEKAENDNEFEIFTIQDPANEVKEIFYDDGWKNFSQKNENDD